MKLDDLIVKLQELQEEGHGEMEVQYLDEEGCGEEIDSVDFNEDDDEAIYITFKGE